MIFMYNENKDCILKVKYLSLGRLLEVNLWRTAFPDWALKSIYFYSNIKANIVKDVFFFIDTYYICFTVDIITTLLLHVVSFLLHITYFNIFAYVFLQCGLAAKIIELFNLNI